MILYMQSRALSRAMSEVSDGGAMTPIPAMLSRQLAAEMSAGETMQEQEEEYVSEEDYQRSTLDRPPIHMNF